MRTERTGLVVETQRRHFLVEIDDGAVLRCIARGRDLSIACGDKVTVQGKSDDEGAIVAVAPRSTVFYRADEHKQKTVAANVTQVVCVIAADPPYAPLLLDRWLVAARAADVRAVVVCNKSDLEVAPKVFSALKAQYAGLRLELVPLHAKVSADALRPWLVQQRSVLIGQSGMGKSTILNALVGHDARAVGALSAVRNAGTHTTTHSKLFHLDETSWVIDSPGMQVFGIAHLNRDDVNHAFPELAQSLGRCRFRNCAHLSEPDCAVRTALVQGVISDSRFQNFLQLRSEVRA